MAKMTKVQAKRRLNEMGAKAGKLFVAGYITMKDYDAIQKIVQFRRNKLS
jgi:hypothetical protein